jgi:serine/threonine protein kinase
MQYADYGTLMDWSDSTNLYIRNERIYERVLSYVRPATANTEDSKNDVEHVARFIFR